MNKPIENIKKAVEAMHNCIAKHEGSIPVMEMFGRDTTWEGVVEAFVLSGHPKAKRCYGWSFEDDDGETQFIGVLELPPVNSPKTAVRAAIANGQQK